MCPEFSIEKYFTNASLKKPEIDFSRPVNCCVAGINADIIIHAYYIKWKLRNSLGKSPKYHFSMISLLYALDTRKNDAHRERRLEGLENKMRVVKGLPQATWGVDAHVRDEDDTTQTTVPVPGSEQKTNCVIRSTSIHFYHNYYVSHFSLD